MSYQLDTFEDLVVVVRGADHEKPLMKRNALPMSRVVGMGVVWLGGLYCVRSQFVHCLVCIFYFSFFIFVMNLFIIKS
jgi:hypothetical protein